MLFGMKMEEYMSSEIFDIKLVIKLRIKLVAKNIVFGSQGKKQMF